MQVRRSSTMPRPTKLSAAAMLAITAFVLVLGACGGGDDDADSVDDAIKEAVDEGNLDSVPENVGGAPADLPDACALVTVDDASELFGEDAAQQDDVSPVDIGVSCLYGNAGEDAVGTVKHLLQVRVFEGEQFYGADAFDDEEDLEGLGDKAFVRNTEGALGGVEVQFVQDGKTVALNYSTVNIGVDEADQVEASDRDDEVVALAQQASSRL
jgi:hypothetical protein